MLTLALAYQLWRGDRTRKTMYTFIPALGSRSVVRHTTDTVSFTSFPLDEEDVLQVWTNASGEWKEHTLEPQDSVLGNILRAEVPLAGQGKLYLSSLASPPPHLPAGLSATRSQVQLPSRGISRLKLVFSALILTAEFTYRILKPSGEVEWLSGLGSNGVILLDDTFSSDAKLPLIEMQECTVRSTHSPNLKILDYELPDTSKEGDIESFNLGRPSHEVLHALTLERSKRTWIESRIFTHLPELGPERDSLLLLLRTTSGVVVYFPIVTKDAIATVRGSMDGKPEVWLRSQREKEAGQAKATCIVGWGAEYELLKVIEDCVEAGRAIIGGEDAEQQDNSGQAVTAGLSTFTKPVFCTWNSLGQDYTLSGVLKRLQALEDSRTLEKIDSVLLDDGWQDVGPNLEAGEMRLRCLRSFDTRKGWFDVADDQATGVANGVSGALPSGGMKPSANLKRAIAIIKSRFPRIKHVGVWLTLEGYWSGLHPKSPISEHYELFLAGHRYDKKQGLLYLPALGSIQTFWRDYFTSLHNAGVSYVKVDNQAELDYVVGDGAAEIRRKMGQEMRKAADAIFGPGNLINCMAGSPGIYSGEMLSHRVSPANSLR